MTGTQFTVGQFLAYIGRTLWAGQWKAMMAQTLNVKPATIDSWSKDHGLPKNFAWNGLAAAIQDREVGLEKLRILKAGVLCAAEAAMLQPTLITLPPQGALHLIVDRQTGEHKFKGTYSECQAWMRGHQEAALNRALSAYGLPV